MSQNTTIALGSETPSDLEASLVSTCCPQCGGTKAAFHTLCPACFDRTPAAFRGPLVAERPDALRRALLGLGIYRMVMPPRT